MICKNCGKEMDDKAVVCISCGHAAGKNGKKKFYKKWWFWVLVILGIIIIAANGGGDAPKPDAPAQNAENGTASAIQYEKLDLRVMLNDLKGNAFSAEEKYQGKYLEVSGEISNFDSDGAYISIKPVGADAWSFESMMCYIKNEEQKQVLLQKKVGDTVTVRGKIKSIGEVLGFSMDIDTIE